MNLKIFEIVRSKCRKRCGMSVDVTVSVNSRFLQRIIATPIMKPGGGGYCSSLLGGTCEKSEAVLNPRFKTKRPSIPSNLKTFPAAWCLICPIIYYRSRSFFFCSRPLRHEKKPIIRPWSVVSGWWDRGRSQSRRPISGLSEFLSPL